MTQPELEQQVARCLTQRGLTLSVAESCTGGLLSKRITDVAGASKFYKGGACTYCNEIKHKILGVRTETLERYTAVSQQTAAEMAQGIARVYETDLGVGITGYAGPGRRRGRHTGRHHLHRTVLERKHTGSQDCISAWTFAGAAGRGG